MNPNRTHPCPPPEPAWWAGRSEEPLEVGPCATREEAILEIEPDDESPEWRAGIFVGLYRQRHINLAKYFDATRWIEWIADDFEDEDGPDENGDRHPLEEITLQDAQDLEACIRSAIWHWQNRRQKPLKTYWLDCVSYSEIEK